LAGFLFGPGKGERWGVDIFCLWVWTPILTKWHSPHRRSTSSGTEEQTARAISAYAQRAFLISLQMGSLN
jgi:hypothetical protein